VAAVHDERHYGSFHLFLIAQIAYRLRRADEADEATREGLSALEKLIPGSRGEGSAG
jgi:hypothetical protein